MNFIKNFFNHDKNIIGLCSLRKKTEYIKINTSNNYKKTYIIDTSSNYLLQ